MGGESEETPKDLDIWGHKEGIFGHTGTPKFVSKHFYYLEQFWNCWFMKTSDFVVEMAFPNALTNDSLKRDKLSISCYSHLADSQKVGLLLLSL